MKLAEQNILIISPESWNHIWVSKHHYAHTLAKMGAKVVFANPPKDNWQIKATEFDNLRVLNYPKFIPGLRKFPSFLSQRIIKGKLKQIEKYCDISFDIIWSFDNSVFFDFTLLKPRLCISHIVDLNMNFEFKKAAKTAVFCFNTTPLIGNRLKQYNSNCHFINHGYTPLIKIIPKKLPGENKTKAVYAGNLNMGYLDWEQISKTIINFPEIDFIFIGPYNDDKKENNPTHEFINSVFEKANTYLTGRINSNELPSYYASANALIICYQEAHHQDQANPHKMMEYLGTGKPVLATYTSIYEDYEEGVILMCQKNNEFTSKLRTLTSNYEYYNSSGLKAKRKAIAQENTYAKQIERIEKIINEQ